MKIAFCHDHVLPAKGGCGTYISDISRRLAADGHEVHLFACRWDAAVMPSNTVYHELPAPRGPRWLRPWRFSALCAQALQTESFDVTVGFDKTYGQDVLYPQGGLHIASAEHNLNKYAGTVMRRLAGIVKSLDPAHWSFCALESRQYEGQKRPIILAISDMVRRHFLRYYDIGAGDLRVLHAAIDPGRFAEKDRLKRRLEWRQYWRVSPAETVAVLAAMNYRLKGLEPLLHALRLLPSGRPFRLLVVGDARTGPYEKLARRLGVSDSVCFVGHCADMRNAYFAADFLVHPTFYDPCSLVVLEALACGLPIVTTRFNGARELLSPPREGYVVDDPHNHENLAWCIEQLLDPSRRAACAQAARKTAGQWTFEHHYQQLLQVFAEAAARKRAA